MFRIIPCCDVESHRNDEWLIGEMSHLMNYDPADMLKLASLLVEDADGQ